jgi:hypothetical protein
MRTALAIVLVLSLLVLPACQMNERLSGTVFGAMGGAGIGALAGGWGGAAIGLVAGGVAGYLVGDYLSDKRECGRCGVFSQPSCEPPCAPSPCASPGPVATAPTMQPCAEQAFVRGVKEYPLNPAARSAYQRGRAALTAAEARGHFEESIRLDPRRPEPYNALGLNYLYAGDTLGAERLFRMALQQDPDYYAAKYNLERMQSATLAAR